MVWHAAEGGPALSADQWNAGGGESDGAGDGLPDPAERGPAEGGDEAAPDDGADRVGHDADPGSAPTGEPPANDKPPVEGGDAAAPDDGADRPGEAS